MAYRYSGWMTGAFIFSMALLSIHGSGCKEGSNSLPLSTMITAQDSLSTNPEISGTFLLSGTVKSGNDPLAQATVTLIYDGKSQATTTTTGEGKFIFNGLKSGQYELTASKTNYSSSQEKVTVYLLTDGKTSPLEPEIFLSKNSTADQGSSADTSMVASGTLRDAFSGAALEYVKCTIKNANISTITDRNGKYRFPPLDEGSYEVEFSKDGYSTLSTTFRIENKKFLPSSLNYLMGYVQDTGKGLIMGRFVIDPYDKANGIMVTSDLNNAVVRIYKQKYIGQLKADGALEYGWSLESATPEPVKSTNLATDTSFAFPGETAPDVSGSFKISHLDPTSETMKYLIFIGKNSENIETTFTTTTSSFAVGEDVISVVNKWYDIKTDDADTIHSWKFIDVAAQKTVFLTNFEEYR